MRGKEYVNSVTPSVLFPVHAAGAGVAVAGPALPWGGTCGGIPAPGGAAPPLAPPPLLPHTPGLQVACTPAPVRGCKGLLAAGPLGVRGSSPGGARMGGMEPSPGTVAEGGPPAPRLRRRRSLRRLFSRFLLALGSRSRPEDSPSWPWPQPEHCDSDGEGDFACARAPAPAAPGSPGGERPPGLQPQLPAGDGARPPGAQGLKNHGNTCFMNAVVQCLSNTDLLAEFLALGRYRAAPGRAEVTEHLAALVRALWTREYTPQLSAEFKNAVSKYGSQFQGNSQHDALEFLLWLLDRVHEDLEGSSRGSGSDKLPPEASQTSENHLSPSAQLSLGQSFVQSHFQAQYRSSLTCPHCLKQSNTFDPFLCVSLPIPLRQTRFLSVTLAFPSQSQRFLRVGLAVPILSTVAALRKMVAEEGSVPVDEVILVELYPSGLQRSFSDEEDLNSIAEEDNVYAFRAPPPPSQEVLSAHPPGLSISPRLAAREGQRLSLPAHSENKVLILFCNLVGSGQQASRFGPPFLIREDRTISWAQLQQRILSNVRYLMKSEALGQQNPGSLFSIRVVGQSLAWSYLSPQDSRPLCHWAVDRALHLRKPGGPPHVKLAVEWDSCVKERLFGSLQEERVQEADSVWRQQQAHQQHSCTLDECFQFYTKEEQLAQDDAWKCPHCKALQQGMVKLSLWTLPDILIIHLKRFCQVGERRNKLSTLVKFPLCSLNMAPHVAQRSAGAKPAPGPWPAWKQPACLPTNYPLDFLYDLYAVCNHHGSLQAYCRNSLDGQWYSYDDSTVESLLEDEVITRGAYILFYQKRNSIPSWSASSSMRGSTSSSLSDHWLLRLGSCNGSPRGSPLSWNSAPGPSRPQVPNAPIVTNSPSSQKKGLESRPLVRGVKGRSISMKVPAPSRDKQGAFTTMPLRWSFGRREKPLIASVELVEYLESRRRPRSTSRSIVPLLTGASGWDEEACMPRSNATVTARGEDREQANERVPAGVPCPSGHLSHRAVPGTLDGLNPARKPKEYARQDAKLPRQFDLPLTVMPSAENERRAQPKDQRTANWKGTGQVGTSSRAPSPKEASSTVASVDTCRNFSVKVRAEVEGRDSETHRLSQRTLTLLRSVFWKKENKKNGRAEVAPISLGSGRLSPAVNEQAPVSSSCPGMSDSLAKGLAGHLEGAVRSAPSSLHLPRKASLSPRASVVSTSQRSVPGEKTSLGTLKKVKYHTLSLDRKKTLPESSF
ncbi:ubiquitin carboxyl-terminal hydrolase 43 isoform X2 [Desmodus rotundus]|uniref:ubiquitin carboxyl-terminal hydrolase 43 isoform X2 n=1 Tax=Desmodus rotundus TaxID=9430 RepID=UPI002381481F|nr:ubiquitin carboxyl-terminal hydrolase 43 isoform X2 [Desmodus rotundus]